MLNPTDLPDTDLDGTDAVPSGLASFLAAAAAPPTAAELAGEQAAVTAFAAVAVARTPTAIRPNRVLARRGALLAVAAFGLAGVGGAAAAATGSLPDGAQDVARTTLTKVGVDVPGGKGLATAPGQLKADTASTPPRATPAKAKPSKPAKPAKPSQADGTHPDNKGATISGLAHDDDLTGAEKGAAISNAASAGKSHGGEVNPTKPETAGPSVSSPGVTAPGRTTASTAGPRSEAGVPAPKGP